MLKEISVLFFIFKFLMLALSYRLYLIKKEPFYSALLFSIPLSIVGLFMGHALIGVFIGSAILFALAFVSCWLLSKVPNGKPHYIVLGVTALVVAFAL
ncbi:MAG: hypothetical protein ACI93V_000545 [Alteromonadaceae bacterium]|jgi:hypothetical protein|tara:strand:- start:2331 stop:2624 length:294 start_codon:yes stop_codon:yes gene_type:complete